VDRAERRDTDLLRLWLGGLALARGTGRLEAVVGLLGLRSIYVDLELGLLALLAGFEMLILEGKQSIRAD